MKRQLLTIRPGGQIVCVYHDENREFYNRLGKGRTMRASDVEAIEGPDGTELFEAKIRIDGAVLPPHESRNEVIRREVEYIENHILRDLKEVPGKEQTPCHSR